METITNNLIRMASVAALSSTVALAALGGAAPAQARDLTLVKPGKSIAGVKLGQTRASVQRSRPLGRRRPVNTARPGKRLSQTWSTSDGDASLVVVYSGRRRASKVVFVSTGQGSWHTPEGVKYGDPPYKAVGVSGCEPYGRNADGSRDYVDSDYDETSCERRYRRARWFYVSFNAGDSGEVLESISGFSLSTRRIP